MPDRNVPGPDVPAARTVAKRRTRPSLVWIVPIVAALVGIWVAVAKLRSEGPTITITFDSAEGLEAGKTTVHYNGVEVGKVTTIELTPDHRRVVATVEMQPKMEDFLVEDTNFWVVRPRISGANVTGLGTLISGAYIGMEIGVSKKSRRDFVALAEAPIVTTDVPGTYFVLKASDLGSLDTGTPLYFRRVQVGQVASYQLADDGRSITVKAFVRAPYDRFVTPETRFWHASGIDMSLSANGLTVQTQSALSILVGGIAFETPLESAASPPAPADTTFTLFADRGAAFEPARGDPQTYVLVLTQDVRGLTRGAPVEFRGIMVGEVAEMRPQFDPKALEFSVLVTVRIYPEMLSGDGEVANLATAEGMALRRRRLDTLVARGLRAQLRTGSLLTGALYVAFDFFPEAPPVAIDWDAQPVQLPAVPGQFEAAEATLVKIVNKLDKLPLEAIGTDVSKALVELNKTLAGARQTLETADKALAPNSALQVDLASTLDQVSRAAQALRQLLDYLERHPEALLRGKPGEGK